MLLPQRVNENDKQDKCRNSIQMPNPLRLKSTMATLRNEPFTISVISVVLNDAMGMERTFRSVQGQTYPFVEHIIIDGQSSDGTLDVIEKFRNEQTVIVSEPDKGIYDAMNKGLGRVSGDAFQFLNAGDIYEDETVLEDVARGFQDTDSRLVYGNNSYVDEENRIVRYWPAGKYAKWKVYAGWVPNHSTAFASSTLIDDCGVFDDSFKNAGDYDLFLRWFLEAGVEPYFLGRDVTRMEIGGFSTNSYGNALLGFREVRRAWKKNGFRYGLLAPYIKVLQKLPQKLFGRIRALGDH